MQFLIDPDQSITLIPNMTPLSADHKSEIFDGPDDAAEA